MDTARARDGRVGTWAVMAAVLVAGGGNAGLEARAPLQWFARPALAQAPQAPEPTADEPEAGDLPGGIEDAPPIEPVPAPLAVPSPIPVPQPTPVAEPEPVPAPSPLATEIPLDAGPGPAAPDEEAVAESADEEAEPEDGASAVAEDARRDALVELREEVRAAEEERLALEEELLAQEEAIVELETRLDERAVAERESELERQDRIVAMEVSEATLGETERLLSTGTETNVGALLDATATEFEFFEYSASGAGRAVEADRAAAALENLAYAREALLRDDLYEARIAIGMARLLARDAGQTAGAVPSPPAPEVDR